MFSYVWSENKDSTHFISTDINKVTRDETLSDAVIETVLPDFYVYPGKSISYTILTQGHRGFMFTIGETRRCRCIKLFWGRSWNVSAK